MAAAQINCFLIIYVSRYVGHDTHDYVYHCLVMPTVDQISILAIHIPEDASRETHRVEERTRSRGQRSDGRRRLFSEDTTRVIYQMGIMILA